MQADGNGECFIAELHGVTKWREEAIQYFIESSSY